MRRIAISLCLFVFCSPFLFLVRSAAAAAECPAPGSVVELFGSMGKDLGISIKLTFDKDRLSGTYIYVKNEKLTIVKYESGVYSMELEHAKNLSLSGSCTGGSLTLQESDASGKPTGFFRGSFTKPNIVEGTWSTPDGKKSLPFHLQAILPTDHVSGKYRTSDCLQEIDIWLDGGEVTVDGAAYWVNEMTGSVHTGDANGTAKLEGDKVDFVDPGLDCRFTIRFTGRALDVSGSTPNCGGANVTFNGTYDRVGPPPGTTSLVDPY